jgi:hypothetical protein
MSWFLAVATMLLTTLLGFLIWQIVIADRPDVWESLAYAFPVGSGVTVIVMLLLSLADQPLSRVRIVGSIVVLIAATTTLRKIYRTASIATAPAKANSVLWWCLLGILVFRIALVVVPIVQEGAIGDWDAWAIWGLKGKAFFVDQSVAGYLRNAPAYGFSWPRRPALTSMMEAFVYSSMGRVDELAARGIHVFWFVSLLWIFYIVARRIMSRTAALFWTLVLSAIPNLAFHSNLGLSNGVMGCYLFAGIGTLDRWRRGGHSRLLVAASVLLGLAALCRDEGLALAILLISAFMVVTTESFRAPAFRKAALHTAGLALGTLAIKSLWTLLVRRYPIADLMSGWLTFDIFSRAVSHFRDLPAVLHMALQELAIPQFQMKSLHLENRLGLSLFWPAFAIAALRLFLGRGRDRLAMACAVTAFAGVLMYVMGFWLFPYQNLEYLRDNWMYVMDRQLLCLIPIATYVIAWSVSGKKGV